MSGEEGGNHVLGRFLLTLWAVAETLLCEAHDVREKWV